MNRLFGCSALGWLGGACGLLTFAAQAQLLPPLTPQLEKGCNWILAFDPEVDGLGNYAFPETNARYWVAVVSDSVPAGSRLVVEGQYPDARYSAFHVHDGNLFVFEAISDNEIDPEVGSVNRNLDETRRDTAFEPGGDYVAYVKLNTVAPAERDRNTLYRPPPQAFDSTVKRRTALAYRTYLAVGNNTGGVGLPRLTLETPDGEWPLPHPADAAACAAIEAQFVTPRMSLPISLVPPLIPSMTPVFQKFDGAALNALGLGVGFNPHNGFMAAKVDRDYDDVLLVRGRLPTFTTQDEGDLTPNVRYWSLCQNGANSTQVFSCLADRDVPLDDAGFYTVVVGKGDERPASLPEAYAWMPFGPEKIGALMVRELLAHPDFEASIIRASTDNTAVDRGPFMPLATYCDNATLENAVEAGLSPEQVFATCAAVVPAASPPPTSEPTVMPTTEPSVAPSVTPVTSPELTPTPDPTPTPADNATPTPTPAPTDEPPPTPDPEVTPTPDPTPTGEVNPTSTPTDEPTPTPFPDPSPTFNVTPTPEPTATATATPSPQPSVVTTPIPTVLPSPVGSPSPSPLTSPPITPTLTPEPTPNLPPIVVTAPPAEPTSRDGGGALGGSAIVLLVSAALVRRHRKYRPQGCGSA